jgi:hypothetical protein
MLLFKPINPPNKISEQTITITFVFIITLLIFLVIPINLYCKVRQKR